MPSPSHKPGFKIYLYNSISVLLSLIFVVLFLTRSGHPHPHLLLLVLLSPPFFFFTVVLCPHLEFLGFQHKLRDIHLVHFTALGEEMIKALEGALKPMGKDKWNDDIKGNTTQHNTTQHNTPYQYILSPNRHTITNRTSLHESNLNLSLAFPCLCLLSNSSS